jgi:hypothetical protein
MKNSQVHKKMQAASANDSGNRNIQLFDQNIISVHSLEIKSK